MTEIWLDITSTLIGRFTAGLFIYIVAGLLLTNWKIHKPASRILHAISLFFLILIQNINQNIFAIISANDVDSAATVHLMLTVISISLYVYTAIGRSIAIYKTPSKTFYSIIPILNLILLFRSTRADSEKPRFWLKESFSIILVILLACAFSIFGLIIKSQTDQLVQQSTVNLKNLRIERAAKIYALLLKQYAYKMISDDMMLMSVENEKYKIKIQIYVLKDKIKLGNQSILTIVMPSAIELAACANKAERYLIEKGIIFEYTFKGLDKDFGFNLEKCKT